MPEAFQVVMGCSLKASERDMISTVLMLLLLVGSFVLFGGLVRFCESIVRPAPAIDRSNHHHDRRTTRAEAVKHFLSVSSG
jgi:hypothetical protein